MTMSEKIQAYMLLGDMENAKKYFNDAINMKIDGRKAVHWANLLQLAPFTVPGIRAEPFWEPAAEKLPMAKVMEDNFDAIQEDVRRITTSGDEVWSVSPRI
jgi:hypothetical protein